jgi:hypothetical protein
MSAWTIRKTTLNRHTYGAPPRSAESIGTRTPWAWASASFLRRSCQFRENQITACAPQTSIVPNRTLFMNAQTQNSSGLEARSFGLACGR